MISERRTGYLQGRSEVRERAGVRVRGGSELLSALN